MRTITIILLWLDILAYTLASLNNSSLHLRKNRVRQKGRSVDINAYPHAGFLYFPTTNPGICGSSLIMVQIVLTAASCTFEMERHGRIDAFFGSTVPRYSKVVRRVVRYEIHPKYNEDKGKLNLAIMFLNRPVPLGRNVQKIPMYDLADLVGQKVYTASWSRQSETSDIHNTIDLSSLTEVTQQVIPHDQCYRAAGYKKTPNMLCGREVYGYHHATDAGAGLVIKKPVTALVGVFSFVSQGISVYSSVQTTQRWIGMACKRLYLSWCLGGW